MTITQIPFDSVSVAEAGWAKMARAWRRSGVIPAEMYTTLNDGAGTGALNELLVYADASGALVKVKSGMAWIQGHYYESDAEQTLTITSNSSGNPRIDRVVLHLDWVANTIDVRVIAGTAAVSPVAPTMTKTFGTTWQIPLAQVAVASGFTSIAAVNVTDERQWPSDVPTGTVVFAGPAANYPVGRGWLPCDGRTVSRVTYGDLLAAMGTFYGVGNGSTTFAIPDLRGRVAVGWDAPASYLGVQMPDASRMGELMTAAGGGVYNRTLTTAELPAHVHGATGLTFAGTALATHTHGTDDPGTHAHTYSQSSTTTSSNGTGVLITTITGAFSSNTGFSGSHTHTALGASGGTPAGTIGGTTAASTGGGSGFTVLQPYLGMNVFIKT